ncbi:MAG: response regulator [Planctomycetota bacterium]|nr:response regulator [Planctomycetota bacterium]
MSNVVIVDSKCDDYKDLVTMVRDCKCNVQVASDYESALRIILTSRVQTLILEWQNSSDEVRAMIEAIRNNHRSRRMHIIAISAHQTKDMVAGALKAKVNDFLSWPISVSEIRERLMWASNEQELLA